MVLTQAYTCIINSGYIFFGSWSSDPAPDEELSLELSLFDFCFHCCPVRVGRRYTYYDYNGRSNGAPGWDATSDTFAELEQCVGAK